MKVLQLIFCLPFAFLSLAWLTPCWAATVSVVDDAGRVINFATPAHRIVSLLPSLTETLVELGAQQKIVGVDRYSNWPPSLTQLIQHAKIAQVGGLDDPLIERIVALRPDVILAASSARSLERLEELGFSVVRLQSNTHEDIQRSLLVVARIVGHEAQGLKTWNRIEQQIQAAAKRIPKAWHGKRVYFEIDESLYAAGQNSFIGQTLTALGLGNIVPLTMGPFPRLNPEFVLQAAPDIIMSKASNHAHMLHRPGWRSIPSLVRQHTCVFNPQDYEVLIRPGPRLGEGAAIVARCLEALNHLAPLRSDHQ